jgi:hypothetical protein
VRRFSLLLLLAASVVDLQRAQRVFAYCLFAVQTWHLRFTADSLYTQCYVTPHAHVHAHQQLYNWQAIRLLAQEKIEALEKMATGDVLTGYKRLRGDSPTAAPAVAVLAETAAEVAARDAMQEV